MEFVWRAVRAMWVSLLKLMAYAYVDIADAKGVLDLTKHALPARA